MFTSQGPAGVLAVLPVRPRICHPNPVAALTIGGEIVVPAIAGCAVPRRVVARLLRLAEPLDPAWLPRAKPNPPTLHPTSASSTGVLPECYRSTWLNRNSIKQVLR